MQARLNEILKRVDDQLERKRMISLFFTNIFHALVQFGFTCYLAGKGSIETIALLWREGFLGGMLAYRLWLAFSQSRFCIQLQNLLRC